MAWTDVIYLIPAGHTKNAVGNAIPNSGGRMVYANKKSIRQAEFYQAQATGLRPEIMFEIRTIEYQGERRLTYDGREYNIIRTFDKIGELTELVCQNIVNKGAV